MVSLRSLSGVHQWRAAAATEALRRSVSDPDFDDSDWTVVPTPGHWQSTDAFATHDGPLLYRSLLPAPAAGQEDPPRDERHWLVSEGIHNAADLWLNSHYLGAVEGYFVPHQFEITDHVTNDPGAPLCVGAEVMSSPARAPFSRARSLVGIWDDSEVVGPTWNAGGITAPIAVVTTGPVRLWNLQIVCVEASESRATIRGTATLLSDEARSARIRTTVKRTSAEDPEAAEAEPTVGDSTHHLSEGETLIEWHVDVDTPDLWWPHSLGTQPLYSVSVEVVLEQSSTETVSDAATRRIGLRSVEFDDWKISINGQRLFVKGAVHWPTQRDLARAPSSKVTGDIDLARELGLDLLRIHTHVARPELYAAADEIGMLLWQDVPLSGRVNRNLKDKAARQAVHMVEGLAHHPSIILWCAHDDPTATSRRPERTKSSWAAARIAVAQQTPSWTKTVFDRALTSAIERVDPTRHVIAHSGTWPSPPTLDGTDSHLWFGWATGTGRDLPQFARRVPRMMRWVSAFGAQSVPEDARFCEPERWPDMNWSNLQGQFGLDRKAMAEFVPTADRPDYDSWVLATQAYQATLLRRQIEALRRLKYRPTGGFCFTALADCRQAISFAIVDDDRRPKTEPWDAVKRACQPVIVVADRLPPELTPGTPLSLDVHVVSDLHHALATHELHATLRWPDGEHTWRWAGQIPADSVDRIGAITWSAPRTPGPVTLDLTLVHAESGTKRASNRYTTQIVAGSQLA